MPKKTSKRIAQLEAALRHIARLTSGYVPDSGMGLIHQCANGVLSGTATMTAVRVINRESVAGLGYGTVYNSCPPQFFQRSAADDWCFKLNLNAAKSWPQGNPGYQVIEIDGGESVDVLTGEPK